MALASVVQLRHQISEDVERGQAAHPATIKRQQAKPIGVQRDGLVGSLRGATLRHERES